MTETLESPRLTEHHIRPSMDSSSHSSASVPPELLADAGRRLGWVALIYVGGTVVGHFGRRAALALTSASGSVSSCPTSSLLQPRRWEPRCTWWPVVSGCRHAACSIYVC